MKVLLQNVKYLVDPQHILLPPLHLIKQYVKALDKTENCFQYLCRQFPNILAEKLKERIFVGPDIRKLLCDDHFESTMAGNRTASLVKFQKGCVEFPFPNPHPPTYYFQLIT